MKQASSPNRNLALLKISSRSVKYSSSYSVHGHTDLHKCVRNCDAKLTENLHFPPPYKLIAERKLNQSRNSYALTTLHQTPKLQKYHVTVQKAKKNFNYSQAYQSSNQMHNLSNPSQVNAKQILWSVSIKCYKLKKHIV